MSAVTEQTRRALIVKFGAIGDVVMAIPAAYLLHQAGFAIDWLCGATVEPILALYPWITPIVVRDRDLLTGSTVARLKALLSLWLTMLGRNYALCATLNVDWRYRLIALPIRARRKLILSDSVRSRRLLPGRHHTDEYARILLSLPDSQRPLSLAPVTPPQMPSSPLARNPERPRVVLAPAGARNLLRDDELRRWPAESYVRLTEPLLAAGVELILIGGPADRWITPAFNGLEVTNLIDTLSLQETVGLMDTADIVVTHDTGPLHMAGITCAGIVTIFGPTDPRGRLPQRPGTLALWGGEGFACRPCYDGRDYAPCSENACMRQVTPEFAAEQILKMLDERTHGILAAPRVITPPSSIPAGKLQSSNR